MNFKIFADKPIYEVINKHKINLVNTSDSFDLDLKRIENSNIKESYKASLYIDLFKIQAEKISNTEKLSILSDYLEKASALIEKVDDSNREYTEILNDIYLRKLCTFFIVPDEVKSYANKIIQTKNYTGTAYELQAAIQSRPSDISTVFSKTIKDLIKNYIFAKKTNMIDIDITANKELVFLDNQQKEKIDLCKGLVNFFKKNPTINKITAHINLDKNEIIFEATGIGPSSTSFFI